METNFQKNLETVLYRLLGGLYWMSPSYENHLLDKDKFGTKKLSNLEKTVLCLRPGIRGAVTGYATFFLMSKITGADLSTTTAFAGASLGALLSYGWFRWELYYSTES